MASSNETQASNLKSKIRLLEWDLANIENDKIKEMKLKQLNEMRKQLQQLQSQESS